jgi:hypothetical protein
MIGPAHTGIHLLGVLLAAFGGGWLSYNVAVAMLEIADMSEEIFPKLPREFTPIHHRPILIRLGIAIPPERMLHAREQGGESGGVLGQMADH